MNVGLILFALSILLFLGLGLESVWSRRKAKSKLIDQNRLVQWAKIKNQPGCGVVFVNRSDHWSGLRYWWIPIEPDLEFDEVLWLERCYEGGFFIDNQRLSLKTVALLGHTIQHYVQR